MSKRLLPQSIESEKKVLGLMTARHDCLMEGVKHLKHDRYFHKNAHQLIFRGLFSLYEKNKKPSLLVLEEELKLKNLLDKVGPATLVEIMEISLNRDEFEGALSIVVDKFNKRNLIEVNRELNQLAYNDQIEGDEFLKVARNLFSKNLENSELKTRIISSGEIWKARRQELIDQTKTDFLKIGYKNLDDLIVGGFMRKQISTIAARPGVGKSALKTNIQLKQLLNAHRVVSFEPEQGFNVQQARLESLITDIPLTEILESYKWKKNDYRVPKIKEANRRIDEEFKYHIIPTRGLYSSDVRPILYEISEKYGPIDLVTVDLFDRFKDVNTTDNTANAIAMGLDNMNVAAEEFNSHICLLVQISREAEKKGDKRPKLSHLKNSGAYEEQSRLVLGMYREKYYIKDSLSDECEVIILKQNNGPLETAYFGFDEDTLLFTEKEEGAII